MSVKPSESTVIPDDLAYGMLMRTARRGDPRNWPAALHDMMRYAKENMAHGLPDNMNYFLAEFPGSRATKLSTSLVNHAHVAWTLRQVKGIILSDLKGLGKNRNKPADILTISFYSAQTMLYQRALKGMIDSGTLPAEAMGRIKVKTLSDAQGDEADFVFGDFVAVDHPGFTGEQSYITLVTTRARGFTTILLNRGTFVGRDKDLTLRCANMLYQLHRECLNDQVVIRVWCCMNCESDGHTAEECSKGALDMSASQCERPSCRKMGHIAARCPRQTSRNCDAEGHTANQCVKDLICSRCGNEGHLPFACETVRACYKCTRCNAMGHASRECSACRTCGKDGHLAKECPDGRKFICHRCGGDGHKASNCDQDKNAKIICSQCGEMGHRKTNCAETECRKCHEKGHTGINCPHPWCKRCRETGHTKNAACNKKKLPKCNLCNGPHDTESCGANRTPRQYSTQQDTVIKVNKNDPVQRKETEKDRALATVMAELRDLKAGIVPGTEEAGQFGQDGNDNDGQGAWGGWGIQTEQDGDDNDGQGGWGAQTEQDGHDNDGQGGWGTQTEQDGDNTDDQGSWGVWGAQTGQDGWD